MKSTHQCLKQFAVTGARDLGAYVGARDLVHVDPSVGRIFFLHMEGDLTKICLSWTFQDQWLSFHQALGGFMHSMVYLASEFGHMKKSGSVSQS